MIMAWISNIFAFIVGAIVGAGILSCMVAASRDDNDNDLQEYLMDQEIKREMKR